MNSGVFSGHHISLTVSGGSDDFHRGSGTILRDAPDIVEDGVKMRIDPRVDLGEMAIVDSGMVFWRY
jgi:hypothetical protein